MEKLQQALQKARSQRDASLQGQPAAPLAEAESPNTDLTSRWLDVAEFQPDPKVLDRNCITSFAANSAATAFDVLRTKTVLMMRKNGWRSLAITSPSPSCGKSTLACNLAVGLSRQPDMRAILVELDLRRPSVAKLLGATPKHDVTEMLTGAVPFADQALRLRENVLLSMAKGSAGDPTRYMLSQDTQRHLADIDTTYEPDIVIFDLPPLLAGDDTRAFLSNVDCALMVARAEKSTVANIDLCEREIADHTSVLGTVLNQCRFHDDTSSYQSYEGY